MLCILCQLLLIPVVGGTSGQLQLPFVSVLLESLRVSLIGKAQCKMRMGLGIQLLVQ